MMVIIGPVHHSAAAPAPRPAAIGGRAANRLRRPSSAFAGTQFTPVNAPAGPVGGDRDDDDSDDDEDEDEDAPTAVAAANTAGSKINIIPVKS